MQTFLSFESSNDDQLIESSENELAIRALQENKKYVFISGPNKSGKTSLAKRFSEKNQKYPVLIRVLSKEFESMGRDKKILQPMVYKNSVELVTDGKSLSYFDCVPGLPLQLEAKGEKKLRILTRLQFSDMMGQEESYRLKVSEGKKVLGTFYFNTDCAAANLAIGTLYGEQLT